MSSHQRRLSPFLLDLTPVLGLPRDIPTVEWKEYLEKNPDMNLGKFIAACKAGAQHLHGIILEMDATIARRKASKETPRVSVERH